MKTGRVSGQPPWMRGSECSVWDRSVGRSLLYVSELHFNVASRIVRVADSFEMTVEVGSDRLLGDINRKSATHQR